VKRNQYAAVAVSWWCSGMDSRIIGLY